jgi:4-amino-4-deoxy-L-arabinose transferase-like glycosyltransferase
VSRRSALVLAVAVGVQVSLSVLAMRGASATFDEGAHLPAGYTHLVLGDHRLNPEQPPLVKLLAAAPLLALHPVLHLDDVAWRQARQWEFGRRFLYRWNDADRLLFLGRLPIVALASCLLLAVFLEAHRRFGPGTAGAAVLLAALSPDVLAHGSLVTTDLGFALFFFLSVAGFWKCLERATRGRVLAAGLFAGAAFATKFSAPILAIVLLLLMVAEAATSHGAGCRLLRGSALLVAVGAIAFAVLWASYGFRPTLSPDPAVRAAGRATLESATVSAPLHAVAAVARAGLVPEDYARGLVFVLTHSRARSTFLMGRLSDHGFPQYFLMTFLLKTPVPLLLLVALALARLPRLSRRDAMLLWLPVAVYLGLTFTRGLQIGHRHLLPVYPFLFVAAGEAVVQLAPWRRPLGLALALGLGLWYAAGTLRVHPHYLAYFNEPAGGPANGWRLLVDSNLDWGQDLKRLALWMRENRVPRLKLSYFGSADPTYYGIASQALPGYRAPHPAQVTRKIAPGDVLAVSVTNLQGVYLDAEDRELMKRIRALTPIGRAGWSIRIYRADFRWPEPGR